MTDPARRPDAPDEPAVSQRERTAVLVVAFLLGVVVFLAVGPASGRWWEAVVVGFCVLSGGDWLGAAALRRWRARHPPRT
ncbi:MAG TPA: hypothetical protein VGI54_09670 [Solirubrobacteraceae bacterium]